MARRVLPALTLALHAQAVLSAGCGERSSPPRKVRFWLGGNHVGPSAPPGNGTAAAGHCKPYLIANLTRYQHAIDSLGVFAYGVRNGTITDDGMKDPGFWPCIRQIKRGMFIRYPGPMLGFLIHFATYFSKQHCVAVSYTGVPAHAANRICGAFPKSPI